AGRGAPVGWPRAASVRAMAPIEVQRRGPTTVLTLNRPEARNAVDGETAVAIAEAVEAFARDDAARVLVVTGAGEQAFCAGADLKRAAELFQHGAVERAGHVAGYPRASLAHDRAEALAAFHRPLQEGIRAERESGIPTLTDPEMADVLARFASGDRPEPPRPPTDPPKP